MFFDVKTGRLIFEADDVMTGYKVPAKRNLIAVCETKIQRPVAETVSYDSLEKKLSLYKINFFRKTGETFVKRLISTGEVLKAARQFSVYASALLVIFVLLYGSVAALDLRFAREAFIGGMPVGFVADTNEFEDLIEDMRLSLSTTLGKEVAAAEKPVYIARIVFGKDITGAFQLRQNIMSTFNEVTEAFAIYRNEQLICGALDEAAAYEMLDRLKTAYVEDGTDSKVEFVDNISVRKEFIPVGYIRSAEGVYAALTDTKEASKTYTVTDSDTLWGIANKFEMSVDDLYALNENLSEMIHMGDELLITKSEPLISVKTSYTYEGEKSIPYETNEIADDSMYTGNRKVISEGVEGKKHVVEEVVKVNGEAVETKLVREEIISEPIAATVSVGTRKSLATGSFVRPAYGTISSRFGRRTRNNHQGIDIAAPVGTPIKAADGGTVTFSGWQSGYGYLIIINHGNGYQTYYGHCSALHSKVGDKVEKGEHIANVGNTGVSTGPHLHFEVRVDGVPQNPANYVAF